MSADLLIKLSVTPLMMWGVSRAARRWGGALGALLAGLPLTSAPISIYLANEQGAGFAARAAVTAISGVAATVVFYGAYAACGKRLAAGTTLLASFLAFLLSIALFRRLHLNLWGGCVLCLASLVASLMVLWALFGRGGAERIVLVPPAWDLPARMLVSTAVVLLVTGSAGLIGTDLSGLLSPIPAVTWPLLAFGRHQGGLAEALAIVRGSLGGVASVLTFYVVVALGLPGGHAPFTYIIAVAASLVVTGGFIGARRLVGGARPS